MNTCIVIPMKDPRQSKQRLSAVLDSSHREDLALSLFKETLDFLRRHFPDYPVLVVTSSACIQEIAAGFDAHVLMQTQPDGLNGAANLAAQWCCSQGFDTQLLIPADIAVLDEQEIEILLSHRRSTPSVVICPSSDDGTNALMTSPPDVVPFCFGIRSSRAHLAAALARGVHCTQLQLKNLAFDVDNPDDLEHLASLPNRVPAQEVLSLWNSQ
ncbi:MAG: 2-phospho-L-lactate guanylyltransferase [Amphritea sp.]